MAAKTAPRRKPAKPTARPLLEWAAAAPSGSPLKVDRDRRVIEGVSVLGRYSRNSHGVPGAEGTEYTPACMDDAVARGLYEGAEVLANHDTLGGNTTGLKARTTHRGVEYIVGVIRNARRDGDRIRGDLHYFESHPMAARVLEDCERGLGVLGLSHDASAGRERVDRAAKRLVIESLAAVRSVDLVRKPATNRNLWEGQEQPAVKTTLRALVEDLRLTPARKKWATWLLEDEDLGPTMGAEMDAPDDGGGDPDAALWEGFKTAIMAILDSDATAEEKAKKIGKYIKGHAKLAGDADPKDEPPADDEGDGTGSDDDKTEAVKAENARLKHQIAVRKLCEELKVTPSPVLLESCEKLPDVKDARRLIEAFRAGGGRPTSAGHPGGGGGGKPAAVPTDGKAFGASIRD